MADHVITSTTSTNQTLAAGDSYFLLPGVTHYSTSTASSGSTVYMPTGGFADIFVHGTLMAQNTYAIRLEDGAAVSNKIHVAATGSVSASLGGVAIVSLGDFLTVVNDGTITGGSTIYTYGDNSTILNNGTLTNGINSQQLFAISVQFSSADLVNTGLIGGFRGVEVYTGSVDVQNTGRIAVSGVGFSAVAGSTSVRVDNSGEITASTAFQIASGSLVLTNTGSISGLVRVDNSAGNALITNAGEMESTLIFGDGEDRYIGTDGVLLGTANAGAGNDTLAGGSNNDSFAGGTGDDVLRGGHGADWLDGDGDNDMLRGDAGDDTLIGDSGFDTLYGSAGDDSLDGGGRTDLLVGGKGNDTMTGGGGGDLFVIRRVGNGDDEVTDFQNGSDRVDISALGVQNFNALNNTFGALSQDTDGVVIDLAAAGGSGSIRLIGMTLADMDASDFLF